MTEETKVEEVQSEVPGLGMGDLVTISRIIDLATKRGAFSAEEAGIVGGVWSRLAAFLKHNMPAEAPAEAPAEVEAPVEGEAGWVDPTPQSEGN